MSPIKILIVEDEILIARRIELILKQFGYETVAIAIDGLSALQKVVQFNPELVLMDISMPGEMDGIETANQIHLRYRIPVIFLTSYSDTDTLERAKATQPFGYLLKPCQPKELDIAIQVALVRHNMERQKLDTLRMNISSSLPHEIRTPLSGILGFINLLMDYYDSMSKVEILEILESIQNSAFRLDRACQNFLLYTKLETAATDPEQRSYLKHNYILYPKSLVQELALNKAEKAYRVHDLQLELEDIPIQISLNYLLKIVEELLDNAFKFSEPGTVVQLKTTRQAQKFVLSVCDRGRGLTLEQIGNLGAYVQFDRHQYEQQGFGLGLTLVKRLVELHDGTFEIASTAHQGTTVTVILPSPETSPETIQIASFD
jgi:signal transduction histidine kinase